MSLLWTGGMTDEQALQFVSQESMMKVVREMVAAVGIDLMADGSGLNKIKDKGILFFG
jgi:hypothetical protein